MSNIAKRNKPRLIQGLILKCVDGHWMDGDGLTPAGELVVVATTRGLQCWKDKELLDEIVELPGEPLPDVDALNEQIPRKEWELGLDGQPRPPWSFNWVAYLLDLESGQRYTYLNSTFGAKIAVERLEDRMNVMRDIKGPCVRPIINLSARVMKTRFGQKQRPDFCIIEFRDFSGGRALLRLPGRDDDGGSGQPAALPPPTKNNPDGAAAKPPTEKKKVGKSVKPPTVGEEIDDGLPDDLAPPNPLQAG